MIYEFRYGKTYCGLDPQTTGDELERIRVANGGRLPTAEVVRWAAEPDSPLHGAFTWDNERAAHARRLDEARELIKAVVVVAQTDDVPQPAFYNVGVVVPAADPDEPAVTERYYQSAAVIAQNPNEFASALKLAIKEVEAAERGLRQLQQLAPRGRRMGIKRATEAVSTAKGELTKMASVR